MFSLSNSVNLLVTFCMIGHWDNLSVSIKLRILISYWSVRLTNHIPWRNVFDQFKCPLNRKHKYLLVIVLFCFCLFLLFIIIFILFHLIGLISLKKVLPWMVQNVMARNPFINMDLIPQSRLWFLLILLILLSSCYWL